MPRNNHTLIAQRNRDLLREFKRLSSQREHGVQKYHYEYILAKLSQRFYLMPSTIERILKTTPDERDGQMELWGGG